MFQQLFLIIRPPPLGIGTTSPSQPLHVNVSTAATNTNLFIDNSGVSGGYNAILRLKNSAREWLIAGAGAASGLDSSGALGIYDQTAAAYRFAINSTGNVGIGTYSPGDKLDIYTNATAGHLYIGQTFSGNYNSISLNGQTGNSANFYSSASDQNLYMNRPNGTGMFFRRNNATTDMYLDSNGMLTVGSPGGNNGRLTVAGNTAGYGIRGEAGNGSTGAIVGVTSNQAYYAILGFQDNYGVYAYAPYPGYFQSTSGCYTYVAHPSFGVYSNCNLVPDAGSDRRLKDDIKSIDTALDKMMAMKPVSFLWKKDTDEYRTKKGLQFGFVAQEMRKVLPEIVGEKDAPQRPESEKGKFEKSLNEKLGKTLTINYEEVIPFAVKAIQELSVKVEKLAADIPVKVADTLKEFGIEFMKGVTRIASLIADHLTVGSASTPAGITLYDEDTKAPYCLKMKGGKMVSVAGVCVADQRAEAGAR